MRLKIKRTVKDVRSDIETLVVENKSHALLMMQNIREITKLMDELRQLKVSELEHE